MTCVEAEQGAPLRVVVVGTSGAGKSTFSAALAARLGCTHVELDRLYWGPGWQAVPHERFEHAVEQATTAPRWVADGNYSAVRELLWGRATHVVWLNFGRWTVFSRVLRRTLARGLLRTRLSHGNRESMRMAFCSRIRSCSGHGPPSQATAANTPACARIRGSRICAGWRLASRGGWGR